MKHNPNEAPEGFTAVPKDSIRNDGKNLCMFCDWRPQCNDPNTDLLAFGHRCMSYAVVALRDGKTYQREDGCSVLFKRNPQHTQGTELMTVPQHVFDHLKQNHRSIPRDCISIAKLIALEGWTVTPDQVREALHTIDNE